ncbi:MAG TPA: hypothetical protein PKK50_00960 [Myxococcota bacterium]|nr:hypothetical protein [Myxococcota bacterium]
MTFRTFLALTLAVLPALSMVPAAAPAAEDPAAVADVEAQEQEPVGANDIRPSEPETPPSDDQVTGTAVVVGEEPQKEPGALQKLISSKRVRFEGSYQLHYTYMPLFDMDGTGGGDGLKHQLDHRLNLRPTLVLWQKNKTPTAVTADAAQTEGDVSKQVPDDGAADVVSGSGAGEASVVDERVELFIDVDLLGGQLAGSTSDAAASALLFPRDENDWTGRSMLRELKISWTSIAGRLDVGQIAADWGLGMVFNPGRPTVRDWTDNLGGDLIERLSFDCRPFSHFFKDPAAQAFHVMVAGDVVFKDDMADLMDSDGAYGFTTALYFDHNPEKGFWRTFSGVYVNYRWQKYANGDRVEVTTTDLFSRHALHFSTGDSLTLEVEAALSAGSSTRVINPRAPDGADILGWGMVARATYGHPFGTVKGFQKGLDLSLELGLASGDSDSGDEHEYGFSFDPSYQVGMILFQDVLGRSSAWSAARASDQAMGYQPRDGWEYSVTNGAVTNALYVHPQLRVYPVKGLDIRLGFLWARGLSPVASYYNSLMNGGYPLSFGGGPASRDLGVEVDAGVYYTTPAIWKTLAVKLGVTGGWCRPGDAFAAPDGSGPGNLFKVRLGVDVVF